MLDSFSDMRYNLFMSFLKRNFAKLLILAFFSLPVLSHAQIIQGDVSDDCAPGKICNPINADTIHEVIQKFLEGALKIGMPIIALAIIYCGFLFVAARGNSEKISQAKDALLYTVIGAGILLGAWALATLIAETVKSL